MLSALFNRAVLAERGLTVDDMFALEDIGRVMFDPAGTRIVFERLGPYGQAPSFGRELLAGKDRSHIFVADLTQSQSVRPLFPQERNTGYWLGPASPDGTQIVLFWIANGAVGTGVYDFGTERLKTLPLTPELLHYGQSPIWISDHVLIYLALPDGQQPFWASSVRKMADELPGLWRHAERGDMATASVLASGDALPDAAPEAEHLLLRVDLQSGTVTRIDRGSFTAPALAPDGRHLAVLKLQPPAVQDRRLRLLEPHPMLASRDPELMIYPLAGSKQAPITCDAAYPLAGTLAWSTDGRKLAFLSRSADGRAIEDQPPDQQDRQVMMVNVPSRSCRRIPHDGLRFRDGFGKYLDQPKILWLGDRIAIEALSKETARPLHEDLPPHEKTAARTDSPDWYLLRGDLPPLNLTERFAASRLRPLAATKGGLIMLAEGKLWRISPDGDRHPVTATAGSALTPWEEPLSGLQLPDFASQHRLSMIATRETGEQRLLVLDPATRQTIPGGVISREDRILAVSLQRGTAILRRESTDGSRLMVLPAAGEARALLHFNRHLADVADSQPIPIRYARKDKPAAELSGWLLLPSGHKVGVRHPLIVIVYPGAVWTGGWPWKRSSISPFNPYLLTAKGYAVLYPSIPLGPPGQAGDPLMGLAETVLPAVERSIELGSVDPERLGLFGQSYGGYGVLGLLSESDRFKAAVAAAAPVNLLSAYGQFDPRFDRTGRPELFMDLPRWAEADQGRMGVPPWDDAERYLRNSPLFYVERIRTPLMLIQGDRDFIPVSQGEEMFSALYRLQKTALFVRYWGEGHVLTSPANIRDFWDRLFDWYDRYLNP
ncbi:S9 family peptidase [Govanella unica]|uniref:Prolyl oligopeptidase family serine peptidase n=1 Tax=Govanella unica TaxID=2975056 RepID=A0A9X3TXT9_9PROT|nr:prolyl oligopeptidase family serine peptidase [Govania unica]MDA5193679.1 prolyl oligopeptidase family serine peptidase [Govania unica]